MGLDPWDFFESFARGDLDDFRRKPSDLRLAFNACVSADAALEHIYKYCRRHASNAVNGFGDYNCYRLNFESACQDWKIVHGISNAYKHLYTYSNHEVASGGSLVRITINFEDHEDSVELDSIETVVARTRSGNQYEVLSLLGSAHLALEAELQRITPFL